MFFLWVDPLFLAMAQNAYSSVEVLPQTTGLYSKTGFLRAFCVQTPEIPSFFPQFRGVCTAECRPKGSSMYIPRAILPVPRFLEGYVQQIPVLQGFLCTNPDKNKK